MVACTNLVLILMCKYIQTCTIKYFIFRAAKTTARHPSPQLGRPLGSGLNEKTTMTIFHPQLDENGKPVAVSRPTRSSHVSAWGDSGAAATFSITDPTLLPAVLNGIALTHAPFECLDWVRFAHELPAVAEPPFRQRISAERAALSSLNPISVSGSCIRPINSAEWRRLFPKVGWSPG